MSTLSIVKNVIDFPESGIVSVPVALREPADSIEAGRFGDAHNVAWVVDGGDGMIDVGMAGKSESPATVAYYLLGLGKRKLEIV
jgi:hypothetical protein